MEPDIYLHIHDSFLWCSVWHQVNSDNQPCPGPTEERCLKCVGRERYEDTKARLETVKKHLPKRVYANSKWTAEQAQRELGCDVRVFDWPVPPIPKFHAKKKVGYFGTFYPVKGIDVMLTAATMMPDIQFLFFCDMPDNLKWMLEGKAAIGFPNVVFMGSYHRSNLGVLCNLVDLVAVPSRCESWGLVKRECESLGKKVVATNTGGLNGTVPPGDVNSLVKAIREAL